MAIKNSVSDYFLSTFNDSIIVFDRRLSDVIIPVRVYSYGFLFNCMKKLDQASDSITTRI